MDLTNKKISYIPVTNFTQFETYLDDCGIEYQVVGRHSDLLAEINPPKKILFKGQEVPFKILITDNDLDIDLLAIAEKIEDEEIVVDHDNYATIGGNDKFRYLPLNEMEGKRITFVPRPQAFKVMEYFDGQQIEYKAISNHNLLPKEINAPQRIEYEGKSVGYTTLITPDYIDPLEIVDDINAGKIAVNK